MSQEGIFRIVALRGPSAAPRRATAREPIDYQAQPATQLQQQVAAALRSTAGAEEARRLATQYKAGNTYVRSLAQLGLNTSALLQWARKRANTPLREIDFPADIQEATGMSLADLLASSDFAAAHAALSDSVVTDSILREPGPASALGLSVLKILELLRRAQQSEGPLDEDAKLSEVLEGLALIAPAPKRTDLGQTVEPPPQRPRPESTTPDRAGLKARVDLLMAAKKDFTESVRRKGSLEVTKSTPTENPPPSRIPLISEQSAALPDSAKLMATNLTEKAVLLGHERLAAAVVTGPAGDQLASSQSKVVLTRAAVDKLQPATRQVLDQFSLERSSLGPARVVGAIDREIQVLSGQMTTTAVAMPMVAFAGGYLNKVLLFDNLGYKDFAPLLPGIIGQCKHAVGVADLLLVRQTLKAYELGEFAHVENVLQGELREREHRRLNLREETVETETEQETEKERNLQSTERSELQTEASKQVKSEMGVEAGLTVSGSYGPTVSFSASLNASFSTTTEESQRKATSFSREVTEKTSERVRERVREERRRRVVEQIEELNRHKIDNSVNPRGHVRGIYRWLNKIYDAQVFNYGKRMMYEFVVPEPAAFLIHTLIDSPPADTDLPPKPEPPTYNYAPLKPENLQVWNYQDYVALYRVESAPVPPSQFKFVSYFDKNESAESISVARSAKIAIPDGYEAFGAYLQHYKNWKGDNPATFKLTIGGANHDFGSGWGNAWVDFDEPFRSEMSMAYGGIRVACFGLGVDVYCALTEEGFGKWQREAYAAIMQGYDRLRSVYEEKLAAAKIAQGIKIVGKNPLENQRTIREELKKWVIMLLRGNPYLDLNSFTSSTEPVLSISKSCSNGNYIRFFENAFEWNNMSFVLYPYFWGRHARWAAALQFVDPDPDFASFLKAGAARVQVPVRPGFEKAVAYFDDTGVIWNGAEPPVIGDSMFVPIIQEITESLGKIEGGVPYPEGSQPWEVTVPTSLVVVQDLDEISGIRDILTGLPIKLQPPAPPEP